MGGDGVLGFLVFCFVWVFSSAKTKCTLVLNMTFKNVQQTKVQHSHGRTGMHN